jgi:hypothetical protein
MDVSIEKRKNDREMATFFQETTEAHLECEKQTSVDMESEKKHQVMKPVKGKKKRPRVRKPATERRGE